MDSSPRVIQHAIIQFKPLKGRRRENIERFKAMLERLRDEGERPDVVVLPEAAFTGYFLQGGVRELAVTADQLLGELEAVHKAVWDGLLDVVVGFFEEHENDYYNSSLYAELGTGRGIRHVHRKVFLPTYGVFDEERYQSRGSSFDAFDTRFGRAAMLICEDAWHSISGAIVALKGAEVIYVPIASPVRGLESSEPGNASYWRHLVRGLATEHGVYVAASCLVGFEGGKAMTGTSMLAHPDGRLLAEAPLFDEAILLAEANLDALQAARYENPLLSDLRATLPRVMGSLEAALERGQKGGASRG